MHNGFSGARLTGAGGFNTETALFLDFGTLRKREAPGRLGALRPLVTETPLRIGGGVHAGGTRVIAHMRWNLGARYTCRVADAHEQLEFRRELRWATS